MDIQLPENAKHDDVVNWLRNLVRQFGIGFHPDTMARDYVLPNNQKMFSAAECAMLDSSLDRVFSILGNELPYEISAGEASAILAIGLGIKPPLEYHDPDFQHKILTDGSRDEVIAWLSWNDPNGVYTDKYSESEGIPPLSLTSARVLKREQCSRELST